MRRILFIGQNPTQKLQLQFLWRSAGYPTDANHFNMLASFAVPAGFGTRVEETESNGSVEWLQHKENGWIHKYVEGVVCQQPPAVTFTPDAGSYSYFGPSTVHWRQGLLSPVPIPTPNPLLLSMGTLSRCQSWWSDYSVSIDPKKLLLVASGTLVFDMRSSQVYKIGSSSYSGLRTARIELDLEINAKLNALGGWSSVTSVKILGSQIDAPQNLNWVFNVVRQQAAGTLPIPLVSSATLNGSVSPPPTLPSTLDLSCIKTWPSVLEKRVLRKADMGNIFRGCIDALSECAEVHSFSIENMNDIIELKTTLASIAEVARDGIRAVMRKNPLLMLRTLAACHIIYRYVYKTSKKDGLEFLELVKKIWEHRHELTSLMGPLLGKSRSFYSWGCDLGIVKTRQAINIVLGRDSWANGAYNRLKGIALTPGMFWDAVPLSFVLDWFLPIGDLISS